MARPEIKTWQNLEAAFAGESMAHIKYRYFPSWPAPQATKTRPASSSRPLIRK